jgi:hypothetical protein
MVPATNASVLENSQSPQNGVQVLGSVKGKVIDQMGVPVAGAQVAIVREGETANHATISLEATTDDDGQFVFANLLPGTFRLTISSDGLASQTLYQTLGEGEITVLPDVVLTVATQITEVRVGVTETERAQDEVKQEEKQRVFGVIPNFFVTYDTHPAALSAKMKFELAWKSSVDPATFGAVGVLAGVEQATNSWRGYGQGAQGYAKRYGASYTNVFAGTYIGSAILPSLLKQDPRYFYQGTGSKRSRLLHALAAAVICRGDDGRMEPNYSNIGGALATGGLATLYYPGSQHNNAKVVFSTALVRFGETLIAGVFQEFLGPKITPNLPSRSPGQP